MSDRIISLYDSRNLSEAMSCIQTNVAPSTLIPFYDEDSSIVFLSSKVNSLLAAFHCITVTIILSYHRFRLLHRRCDVQIFIHELQNFGKLNCSLRPLIRYIQSFATSE